MTGFDGNGWHGAVPADAREKALQAMIDAQPSATIAHGRMLAALEGIGWGPGGGRPPRDGCAADGEHRGPLIAASDGTDRLLCKAHWGSTPSVPVVDRGALAKALAEWHDQTEDTAEDHADTAAALIRSGLFRDAADVWHEGVTAGEKALLQSQPGATVWPVNPYRSAS